MTSCSKRQEPCQFCSMMLAHSELIKHEDYCGSRTEACETCGRYIMVRDAEIHRETNCEYPAVEQKDDSEAFDSDFADHFSGGSFGHSLLLHDLQHRVHEMMNSHGSDLPHLEDMFSQMGFHGATSGLLRPDDSLFLNMLASSVDDPPPPYFHDNAAADTHANDGHVTPVERNIPTDNIIISSDDDDDDGESSSLMINLF